jgi:hypothetical protein
MPYSLDGALDLFVYHPATPDTAHRHAAVREELVNTVRRLWTVVPDGPEKTLMIRDLQKAGMWANCAIALTAPADTGPTASIARVLPTVDGAE